MKLGTNVQLLTISQDELPFEAVARLKCDFFSAAGSAEDVGPERVKHPLD